MIKTNDNKVELLAPAGGYEAFIAAINAGADAVYMGLQNFNARVMTNNFTLKQYKDCIDYAHKRDVKVYLTLNTLLLDDEIKEATSMVYELYKVGLDAVIVQDLGVADLIHKILPDLPLHASTQMSVCTIEQVKALEKLGFQRVVLARELSIDEIKYIKENTNLELEIFVHGALCVSVSGQCLMSALIGDRSANRGSCAGPCRKKYSLYTKQGKCIEKNRYLISKKDIFGLDRIDKLIEIGIESLKIEGRNKTPEYVAGVVKNYRQAINEGYNKSQDEEVLQLFNRSGKSYGYLDGVRYKKSISELSPKNVGLYLGKIIATKNKYIKIKLEQDIDMHDGIETVGASVKSTIVTCIRDDKFNIINKMAEKGKEVWLGDIDKVKEGDLIYKTSSSKLNLELYNYTKINTKKIKYNVEVSVKENKNISAKADSVEVNIEYIPEISKTSSVNEDKIKEAFSKTEETSIEFDVTTNIDEGLFVPVSKLNELRKKIVDGLENKKLIRREVKAIDSIIQNALKTDENKINTKKEDSLYVYKYDKGKDYIKYYYEKYNKNLDVLYINASDFAIYEQDVLKYLEKCKVYFVIPNVTLKNTTRYIKENIERLCEKGISGILLGNIGFINLCNKLKEKYSLKIIADYSLNVMNKYTANKLKELGVDKVVPLFETDAVDLSSINEVVPIEIVQDMATVMTTRYCVIASFVKDITQKGKCGAECTKNDYYLLDEQNKKYDVIPDNMDCITRYVRNKRQYSESVESKYSTRHCVI